MITFEVEVHQATVEVSTGIATVEVSVETPGVALGIPGPSGIQGPQGADSTVPGPEGPPNVLNIGVVTTVPSGGAATADITGTTPSQTLNLGIPIGDKGDKGDKGNVGDPGPSNVLNIGTVTTVAPGGAATADITGVSPAQILNLGIPQGLKGDKGDPGSQGTAGEKWYTGSGAPLSGLGSMNDWYLQSNGDYYEKTSSNVWTLRGNLRGPQGQTGVPGSFTVATEISNTDLNTVTTPGIYTQADTGEMLSNYPTAQMGLLEVFASANGLMIWQRYTVYAGPPTKTFQTLATHLRGYYNGTWQPWRVIYSDTLWQDFAKAAGITGTLKWRILNQVVHVFASCTGTFPSGSYTRLDNEYLPPELRPSVSAFGSGNFSTFPGNIFVGNSGDITGYHSSGANRTAAAGLVTYPIGV